MEKDPYELCVSHLTLTLVSYIIYWNNPAVKGMEEKKKSKWQSKNFRWTCKQTVFINILHTHRCERCEMTSVMDRHTESRACCDICGLTGYNIHNTITSLLHREVIVYGSNGVSGNNPIICECSLCASAGVCMETQSHRGIW